MRSVRELYIPSVLHIIYNILLDLYENKSLKKIRFTLYPACSRITEVTYIKTLHSPLSVEYGRHCVLSGGNQRRALPPEYRNENVLYYIP